MKTKIFALCLTLLVLLWLALGLVVVPYHFYYTAVNEGIRSEYLNLRSSSIRVVEADIEKLNTKGKNIFSNENLWQIFHFKNYTVPLPTHNPQVILNPRLEVAKNGDLIGATFVERRGKELLSFIERRPFSFKLYMDQEKIFTLPLVKNKILVRNIDDIWKDIFSLNLSVKQLNMKNFVDVLKSYKLEDLTYKLFILHMRQNLFSKFSPLSISFIKERSYGSVKYSDFDERFINERVYMLRNGVVYVMELRYHKYSEQAILLRDRFLEVLEYKKSTNDSALKIYAHYRTLPYHKRISQEGFSFLFAGWSHTMEKEEFLREMIHFLERGRNNISQLNELYQYASKKYGTSFSKKDKWLEGLERVDKKLERKISEEVKADIDALKENQRVIQEGDFTDLEQRMFYYLNKAKSEKTNIDKSDKKLER